MTDDARSSAAVSEAREQLTVAAASNRLKLVIGAWAKRGRKSSTGAQIDEAIDALIAAVRSDALTGATVKESSTVPPPDVEGWQPIATVPYAVRVLVYWSQFKNFNVLKKDTGYWRDEDGATYAEPTHWMPLPNPPGAESAPPLSVEARERRAFEAGMRSGKAHDDEGGKWEFALGVPWSQESIAEAFAAYLKEPSASCAAAACWDFHARSEGVFVTELSPSELRKLCFHNAATPCLLCQAADRIESLVTAYEQVTREKEALEATHFDMHSERDDWRCKCLTETGLLREQLASATRAREEAKTALDWNDCHRTEMEAEIASLRSSLAQCERIDELLKAADLQEPDDLKHAIEEWQRWKVEIPANSQRAQEMRETKL